MKNYVAFVVSRVSDGFPESTRSRGLLVWPVLLGRGLSLSLKITVK